jgi:hypothetical protein
MPILFSNTELGGQLLGTHAEQLEGGLPAFAAVQPIDDASGLEGCTIATRTPTKAEVMLP